MFSDESENAAKLQLMRSNGEGSSRRGSTKRNTIAMVVNKKKKKGGKAAPMELDQATLQQLQSLDPSNPDNAAIQEQLAQGNILLVYIY